jgi:DNA-binding LacI/PurR family transcriptional regulator
MQELHSIENPTKESQLTVYDIAALARVSIATVSRVLNGKNTVSPEKREAVLRVVSETVYEPNHNALRMASLAAQKRSLRQKRTS